MFAGFSGRRLRTLRRPTPFWLKYFLAIVSGIGIAAVAMGHNAVRAALVFAGVGSMAAAAVVLLLSSPDKARAALTQGAFPVIAIVLLVLGLIS
jgi:putative membrane protein